MYILNTFIFVQNISLCSEQINDSNNIDNQLDAKTTVY